MATAALEHPVKTDWASLADQLGPRFATREAAAEPADAFVAENYAELKAARAFSAGVPAELGGGGAEPAELAEMLRRLGRHCPSTALAFAMHTHPVALLAWRWRHQQAPVEPLLRRIAQEQLVLLTSGGSDWLIGGGKAERADGGFRIYARKVFASGAPAGDLLSTSAVWADAPEGPAVLHFAVPLNAPGVRVVETWRAMGMRATGSHDVEIDGWFLPDAAVAGKRPQGKWHPLFHMIAMTAMPLVYAVYLGVAEAAREAARAVARKRAADPDVVLAMGELDNELLAAQLAHARLVALVTEGRPGPETTGAIFAARTLTANAALRTVEKALQLAGGQGYRRESPLERLFRDIQAARFHPLKEKEQFRLCGRLALGLDIDG